MSDWHVPRHTRRAVLRTGTTAAWAVPVVSVMAAAPAYADSADVPADLRLSTTVVVTDASTEFQRQFTVDHTGTLMNMAGGPSQVQGTLDVGAVIYNGSFQGGVNNLPGSQPIPGWNPVGGNQPDGQHVEFRWTFSDRLGSMEVRAIPPVRYIAVTTDPQAQPSGTIVSTFDYGGDLPLVVQADFGEQTPD